jgi:hypothetical protein
MQGWSVLGNRGSGKDSVGERERHEAFSRTRETR